MSPTLPTFRYHPDPLATGSVRPDDTECACCGQARGYVYAAAVHGPEALRGRLCPWCIASGAAASKYDCLFSDDRRLRRAKVPRPVVLEVTRKTPGFTAWQGAAWEVCCGDACEFHGDATRAQAAALAGDVLERHLRRWGWDRDYWSGYLGQYEPANGQSLLHFICRHCRQPTFALDLA